jgi:hypothetical protein
MNNNRTVLVVGSAGRIGRAVVAELQQRKIPVRGFDIVKTPGVDDCVIGDITAAEDLKRAAAGAGTLIHLAATPDDDDFLAKLLPNNIVGVYHVMEAARLVGVRRLILASSGQVNWWQRTEGSLPSVLVCRHQDVFGSHRTRLRRNTRHERHRGPAWLVSAHSRTGARNRRQRVGTGRLSESGRRRTLFHLCGGNEGRHPIRNRVRLEQARPACAF